MRSIKTSLIAGIAATVAMAAPAAAADMPMVYKAAPVVVEQFGGWYLRGDIGMTNQKVNSIDNLLFTPAVQVLHKDFESGMLFGVGVGYQFNNWFRADVTGEYRGKTAFRGLDIYPGGTNDYYGTKSEWLFLANAYIDLGTWWCVTPFVGAGIGYSRNTMDNFRDVNAPISRSLTAILIRNGSSPGRCTRVLPTRSPRISRRNWRIATSTSAISSRAI